MIVFMTISRDKLKNTHMARSIVHWFSGLPSYCESPHNIRQRMYLSKKTHSSYCEIPYLIYVRECTFQKNPLDQPLRKRKSFILFSKKLQNMCQDRIVWIESIVFEIYITHKIS